MVEFSFKFKNKKISLDVIECKSLLSKARGLMFRKSTKPLLFYFNKKTTEPIHSFFCKPFIAVWFLDNKIIDVKKIQKWKASIRPKGEFNLLLEILTDDKNAEVFYRR